MPWTNVLKPSESSVATSVASGAIAVQPFGLLIAITSTVGAATSFTGASITTGWMNITKPAASVGAWTTVSAPTASVGAWTNISKPV
mgnify:FL=1